MDMGNNLYFGTILHHRMMKEYARLTRNASIKEDMISMADASGQAPTLPIAPGQFMQTPDAMTSDMDTMSLAGPGKKIAAPKKKKKKKKPEFSRVSNRVTSFADFMGRK